MRMKLDELDYWVMKVDGYVTELNRRLKEE